MQPQIVSKPAFAVVGLKYRGKADGDNLKNLWNQFGPRMADIKEAVKPDVCYGVMGNYDEATGEFDYVAGCEVKNDRGCAGRPDPLGCVRANVCGVRLHLTDDR